MCFILVIKCDRSAFPTWSWGEHSVIFIGCKGVGHLWARYSPSLGLRFQICRTGRYYPSHSAVWWSRVTVDYMKAHNAAGLSREGRILSLKKQGFQSWTDRPRGEYSALLLINNMTRSNLSVPHFTHLYKGANNTYFTSLLWILNKTACETPKNTVQYKLVNPG